MAAFLRTLVFSCAVALGFAGPASGALAAGAGDWFRYGPGVETAWDVQATSDQMEVRIRKSGLQLKPEHRVFVLYPRPSSAYDTAITRVLDVFSAKGISAEFTVVNFNMEDGRGRRALAAAISGQYDLILSMGSEATAWLYEKYQGGNIPVVSICSKDPVLLGQMPSYDQGSGKNFAFTSLNVPVEVQMAYLMELVPELKNLAILVDTENVSAVQTQAEPIGRLARRRGIQVMAANVKSSASSSAELPGVVSNAVAQMRKSDPDLSKSVFWLTGSTSVFREIRLINDNADRVPVISVVPEIVKPGADTAAISVGVSFESNGHLAAIYAADILSGKARAGELPVGLVSPPDIAVSFRKTREIGMRVPFSLFETASFVYDYDGRPVRSPGQ
jgi:putative ABC transport system substrate-binding protein